MIIPPKFMALVILAASVLAQDSDCARTYTVKHGDVCNSISATQNVSTVQLARANPEINAACTNIIPGQTLCLGMKGRDCNTTTVVHAGDTCQTISINAGINMSLLLENNPNVDPICSNIYPGEVLCTSKHAFMESLLVDCPGCRCPGCRQSEYLGTRQLS